MIAGALLRVVLFLSALCVVVSAFLPRPGHSLSPMGATNRFISKGLSHLMTNKPDNEVQHIIARLTATRGGVAGNVSM